MALPSIINTCVCQQPNVETSKSSTPRNEDQVVSFCRWMAYVWPAAPLHFRRPKSGSGFNCVSFSCPIRTSQGGDACAHEPATSFAWRRPSYPADWPLMKRSPQSLPLRRSIRKLAPRRDTCSDRFSRRFVFFLLYRAYWLCYRLVILTDHLIIEEIPWIFGGKFKKFAQRFIAVPGFESKLWFSP